MTGGNASTTFGVFLAKNSTVCSYCTVGHNVLRSSFNIYSKLCKQIILRIISKYAKLIYIFILFKKIAKLFLKLFDNYFRIYRVW